MSKTKTLMLSLALLLPSANVWAEAKELSFSDKPGIPLQDFGRIRLGYWGCQPDGTS